MLEQDRKSSANVRATPKWSHIPFTDGHLRACDRLKEDWDMRLEIGGAPPAKGCWRRSDCRKAHRARTTCTSRTRENSAVSIVSGHNRSLRRIFNQISALFITVCEKARPKIVFIGREARNREPTAVITLPASGALLMIKNFARDFPAWAAENGGPTYFWARSAA